MKVNEFRARKGFRRHINEIEAYKEQFYFIQQKKIGFFGGIKWIDYLIPSYSGWDNPEFKELKDAQEYIKELKDTLK